MAPSGVAARPQRGSLLFDGPFRGTDGRYYYLCTLINVEMSFPTPVMIPFVKHAAPAASVPKGGNTSRDTTTRGAQSQPAAKAAECKADGLVLTRTFCLRDSTIMAFSAKIQHALPGRVIAHPTAKSIFRSTAEAASSTMGSVSRYLWGAGSAASSGASAGQSAATAPTVADVDPSLATPSSSPSDARSLELLAFLASVLDDTEDLLQIPIVGSFFMTKLEADVTTLEHVPASVYLKHMQSIPADLQPSWSILAASTSPAANASSRTPATVTLSLRKETPMFVMPSVAAAGHDGSPLDEGTIRLVEKWEAKGGFANKINTESKKLIVPESTDAKTMTDHWNELSKAIRQHPIKPSPAVPPATAADDPRVTTEARMTLSETQRIIDSVAIVLDMAHRFQTMAHAVPRNTNDEEKYDIGSALQIAIPLCEQRGDDEATSARLVTAQRQMDAVLIGKGQRASDLELTTATAEALGQVTALVADVVKQSAPPTAASSALRGLSEKLWWDDARKCLEALQKPSTLPLPPVTAAVATRCLNGSPAVGVAAGGPLDVGAEVAVLAAQLLRRVTHRAEQVLSRMKDSLYH